MKEEGGKILKKGKAKKGVKKEYGLKFKKIGWALGGGGIKIKFQRLFLSNQIHIYIFNTHKLFAVKFLDFIIYT